MVNPVRELEKRLNGGNQYEMAKSIGVSPAYLSMVLNGSKPPAKSVLDYLGLERVKSVTYRRKKVRN